MTKRELTETELGALFAAQREAAPPPSETFLARIAADAENAAAHACKARPAARPAMPRQWGAGLLALLAPAGVVSAGIVGIWVGVAAPQNLPDPALLWAPSTELSALPDDALFVLGALDDLEDFDGQ